MLAQWPNIPLWVALDAALVMMLEPVGSAYRIASIVAHTSLMYWAYLELTEGVNYFRRTLGGVVLVVALVGLLLHA